MSTNERLESEIECLYATFSQYQADLTDRSPYISITDAEANSLQSRPLRQLTTADLDRYVRSALSTWGGIDEFKHFLPRIFELIVRRPNAIDPLVFEKLEAAEWKSWPHIERDAVNGYIDALWQWALSVGPDVIDAGDLLRGIGFASGDIRLPLDVWRNNHSRAATEQLAHLVNLASRDLLAGKLPSNWPPKDRDAVLEFLREAATQERIEAEFMTYPHGESGRILAAAADVLTEVHRQSSAT